MKLFLPPGSDKLHHNPMFGVHLGSESSCCARMAKSFHEKAGTCQDGFFFFLPEIFFV